MVAEGLAGHGAHFGAIADLGAVADPVAAKARTAHGADVVAAGIAGERPPIKPEGRAGDAAKAEEIYRYGIEHLNRKISLLRNYRILLEQQNRLEEAEEITAKLTQLDDPSPYDWIEAGEDALPARRRIDVRRR